MKKNLFLLPENNAPQARNAFLNAAIIAIAHFAIASNYLQASPLGFEGGIL